MSWQSGTILDSTLTAEDGQNTALADTHDPLNDLPDIAEMPRQRPKRSMPGADKNYAMLGRNTIVQASPAILHFDGYTLKECHTQTVSVVNISNESRRVHILPPTTPNFKIRMNKRGTLAPGMAEHIKVDFYPSEYKYHYDCIRVHTEEENLLIPMHAYPIANDVVFPKLIDFGVRELGRMVRKKYEIKCQTPVQFEYQLDVRKAHPFFKVEPLSGIIPASGSAEIYVEFTPLSAETAALEMVVNVSQFNFQPFVCTVTGSAQPGLSRRAALAKGAADRFNGDEAELRTLSADSPPPVLRGTAGLTAGGGRTAAAAARGAGATAPRGDLADVLDTYDPSMPKPPKGTGSGAVFDAGAAWMHTQRQRLHLAKTQAGRAPPPPGAPPPRPETVKEGLRIPGELGTVGAVNFVLTQVPGKLKPKDLKKAIDEHRAVRAQQKLEQERMRTSAGSLNCESILADEQNLASGQQTRQLKELVFLQEVGELEQAEKDRGFKNSAEHVGEGLMTAAEVAAVLAARAERAARAGRARRAAERARTAPSFLGPYEVPARRARAGFPAGAPPGHAPDFDPYKNDDWRRRRDLLRRLTFLVGKHIARARADRRLRAIKAFLGSATNREEVRAMVEQDHEQAKYSVPAHAKKKGKEGGLGEGTLGGSLRSVAEAAAAAATSVAGSAAPAEGEGEEFDEELSAMNATVIPVGSGGGLGGMGELDEIGALLADEEAWGTFSLPEEAVFRRKFPLFEEDAATGRAAEGALGEEGLGAEEQAAFNDLAHFPLLAAGEGAAGPAGAPLLAPAVSVYLPLEADRYLLGGAEEEGVVRPPRDAAPGWEAAPAAGAGAGGAGAGGSARKSGRAAKAGKAPKTTGRSEAEEEEEEGPDLEAELLALGAALEGSASAPPAALLPPKDQGRAEAASWFQPTAAARWFVPPPHPREREADPRARLEGPAAALPLAARPTEGERVGFDTAGVSVRAYRGRPAAAAAPPRLERPAAALWCEPESHRAPVWAPRGLPRHGGGRGLDPEDRLSDSESDDDGDAFFVMRPTEGLARNYFRKFAAGKPVAEIVAEDEGERAAAAAAAAAAGEGAGAGAGARVPVADQVRLERDPAYAVPRFARTAALAAQEAAAARAQWAAAEAAPRRLLAAARRVRQPLERFAVQLPELPAEEESGGGGEGEGEGRQVAEEEKRKGSVRGKKEEEKGGGAPQKAPKTPKKKK